MLSLVAAAEERHLLAALLFAVLLNLKHIFLYAAPAFFIYLLRRYCRYGQCGPDCMCWVKLCWGCMLCFPVSLIC